MRRARFVALSAASLAATAPLAARADEHLVVTWGTTDVSTAPVWIAYEAGYFRKHGLDVDFEYQASAIQIPSLLSGQAQFAQVGGSNVVSADASGGDIIVLGTLSPVFTYLFMVSPSIKNAAQLKGKIVGVSKFGDASDVGARIALQKLGLDPKDVAFVQVGSSTNRAAALMSGAVQGGVMLPPMNLALEAHGLHTLIDLAKLHLPAANITIATRRSWVESHRPVAQAYMDAVVEGLERMRHDKPYAISVLKRYYKSDDDRAMAYGYDYYLKEVMTSFPYPSPSQFAPSIAELAQTNASVAKVDLGKIVDGSYLQAAVKRVGLR